MRATHVIFGLAALAALVGCGGALTSHGIAKVRGIDALTSPTPVDIFTDFDLVATGLTVGQSSAYSSQTASDLSVGVRQTGTTTTLASTFLTTAPNGLYTVIAFPDAGNTPTVLAMADTFTAPTGTDWKIRFAHVDRLVGNVDVYVTAPAADLSTATPVITNQPLGSASAYVELTNIGQVSVRITLTGTTTTVGPEILVTPGSLSFKTLMLYENSGAKTVLFSDQN